MEVSEKDRTGRTSLVQLLGVNLIDLCNTIIMFFFSEENRSRGGDDESRGASSSRRSQLARGSTQTEGEEWSFRGYNRIRGSREAVSGAKSTCSGTFYFTLVGKKNLMFTMVYSCLCLLTTMYQQIQTL